MLIQVDLKRNPDVADLIADMEMGAPVSFVTTLKSKSGELAEFTLERAEEGPAEDKTGDSVDNTGDEGAADEAEPPKVGNGAGGSKNTPGGSQQQDRMAAALAAQL